MNQSSQQYSRYFRLLLPFIVTVIFFILSVQFVLAMTNQAKLTTSPAIANSYTGLSVAIDGDIVVVGAPSCSPIFGPSCTTETNRPGLAYVYIQPVGGWMTTTQVVTLTASNATNNDNFGFSVSVAGDTIVVGARKADIGGNSNQGAAYVFVEPAGGWGSGSPTLTETAILTASDGTSNDEFGQAVAVNGDTILIGAHQDNSNLGSAYIFEEPVGGWSTFNGGESTKLTANILSSDAAADRFGQAVAIDGGTAVVGAWFANADEGAAYIFEEPVGGWSTFSGNQTAMLTASDSAFNDQFGGSVGINNDTIVVGAWRHNNQGAAYVYIEPVSGWISMTQDAKLTASDAADSDNFGNAAAIDADGIAIGAPRDDDNGSQSGSGYYFERPVSGWVTTTETSKLVPGDGDSADRFGWSIALNAGTVVAGAPFDEAAAIEGGAAYVFFDGVRSVADGNWTTPATWVNNTVPVSTDSVTISAGDTVTVNASVQVQRLVIEPGATLIIPNGIILTVEESVVNHGIIQQSSPVNNGRVSLPLIQSSSNITRFVGTTIDSPNNLGEVTATVRGLNAGEYCTQTGAASAAYATRCYEITATTNNTATVRLWALTSELNGIAPGALAVYRYDGSAWTELPNRSTGSDGGSLVFVAGDTPGFSHFLAGQTGPGNSPTAVSLTSFSAHSQKTIWLLLTVWLTLGSFSGLAYRQKQGKRQLRNIDPVHNYEGSNHR